MPKEKLNLVQDFFIIVISIIFAFYFAKSNILHEIVVAMGPFSYLASIIAGIFFVSIFTFAPAVALLLQLASEHSLIVMALLGGIGGVIGDYIIFIFVRNRIADDIAFLLSHPQMGRIKKVFSTKLPLWFTPMIGAIIIASPFPDELGLTMLGLSHISTKKFIIVSFTLNALGLFLMAYFAQMVF